MFSKSIRSSYLSISICAMAALLIVGYAGLIQANQAVLESQKDSLREQVGLITRAITLMGQAPEDIGALQYRVVSLAQGSPYRITVINPEGVVLADSQADPAYMENHAARPEVVAALAKHPAWATRFSHTLNLDMLYYAEASQNLVIRVATPLSHVKDLETAFLHLFPLIFLACALILITMALILYRKLMPPLGRIRSMAEAYREGSVPQVPMITHPRELELIAKAMKGMADELQSRIQEARERNHEMRMVLDTIQEAVLILDRNQVIYRCNAAALRLFHQEEPGIFGVDEDNQDGLTQKGLAAAQEQVQGHHLLSFLRSSELADFLEANHAARTPGELRLTLPSSRRLKIWNGSLDLENQESQSLSLVVISPML